MFWTIAAAVLFAAALIALSPLLRAKSLWQPLALALVFLLPAGALWLYHQFGTPDAINLRPPKQSAEAATAADPHANQAGEMNEMIAGLRERLTETEADLNGWLLLARTLKATQRFEEAAEALETANRIAPGNPQVMVDLVETRVFLTPDGRLSDDMVATLRQVLQQDPGAQKALWLMGIASWQAGEDTLAIEYWDSLLEQLEPGSSAAQAVQSQIDQARSRMETVVAETPLETEPGGSWQGINLGVRAGDSIESGIPGGGVLYIMVRSPGPAMGPPLGVRRIIDPELPLELNITDQDSMLKERLISSESEVQLQARISMSGSPAAASGDWQSAPVTVELGSTTAMELIIDQRVE